MSCAMRRIRLLLLVRTLHLEFVTGIDHLRSIVSRVRTNWSKKLRNAFLSRVRSAFSSRHLDLSRSIPTRKLFGEGGEVRWDGRRGVEEGLVRKGQGNRDNDRIGNSSILE